MRRWGRLLTAVTAVLLTTGAGASAGAAVAASPGPRHDPAADLASVEHWLYDAPMREFVDFAGSGGDGWLDTSTDFCSAPLVGTTGRSFDFHDACRRHDFAYRNLRLLDRRYACDARPAGAVCPVAGSLGTWWTHGARARADDLFLDDMRSHCRHRHWWDRPTCFAWAQTFWSAVRIAGGP